MKTTKPKTSPKKPKKPTMRFPKTIYVVRTAVGDGDTVLVTYEDYVDIEDNMKVGVYELGSLCVKIMTHELEEHWDAKKHSRNPAFETNHDRV